MKKGFVGLSLMIGIAVISMITAFYASYEVKQFVNRTEDINLGAVTALTETIGTFRTNVNATDEALRSITSTNPGHLHTTTGISSTIAVAQGGTGTSTALRYGLAVGSSTAPFEFLLPGANGQAILSNGTSWVGTSTIPIGTGGTGTSTATRYGLAVGSGTAPFEFITPGVNRQVLTSNGTLWESSSTQQNILNTQFLSPGCGFNDGATEVASDMNEALSFADGAAQGWYCSVRVPTGTTSVANWRVYYYRAVSANIVINFWTGYFSTTSSQPTQVDQSMGDTVHSVAGTTSQTGILTASSTSYDAFGNLSPGNIITFVFIRRGADAADTYGAAFKILGAEVTFD